MIVNLAVEHDTDLTILAPHGLLAAGDIQNGQATMTEECALHLIDVNALTVRSTMGERARHRDDIRPIALADKPRDSAHPTNPVRSLSDHGPSKREVPGIRNTCGLTFPPTIP